MVFGFEVLLQFTLHFQEAVKAFYKLVPVAFNKIPLIRLQHEQLVELLTFCREESSNFFYLSILLENLVILIRFAVFRIVPHKVLTQEDGWVKALLDGVVDMIGFNEKNLLLGPVSRSISRASASRPGTRVG